MILPQTQRGVRRQAKRGRAPFGAGPRADVSGHCFGITTLPRIVGRSVPVGRRANVHCRPGRGYRRERSSGSSPTPEPAEESGRRRRSARPSQPGRGRRLPPGLGAAFKCDVVLCCVASNPVEKGLSQRGEDPTESLIIFNERRNRSRLGNGPIVRVSGFVETERVRECQGHGVATRQRSSEVLLLSERGSYSVVPAPWRCGNRSARRMRLLASIHVLVLCGVPARRISMVKAIPW